MTLAIARRLLHARFHSAAVVLLIALGTAAVLSAYAVVDAVAWQELPYARPDRLVRIYETAPRTGVRSSVSAARFLDLVQRSTAFGSMALYREDPVNLTGLGEPVRLRSILATEMFFETLGVIPIRGTTLAGHPADAIPVVLTDAIWRSRFGARPEVIGQTLVLHGQSTTIVGVLPAEFTFTNDKADLFRLWRPNAMDAQRFGNRNAAVIARLVDDTAIDTARSQAEAISQVQQATSAASRSDPWGIAVVGYRDDQIGDLVPALNAAFLCAVVQWMAMAAGVIGLGLLRASSKSGAFALRSALGAPRGEAVRHMTAEFLCLITAGAVVGMLLGAVAIHAARRLGLLLMPRADAIAITPGMMLTTLAAAILFAVALGHLCGRSIDRFSAGGRVRVGNGRSGIRFRRGVLIAKVAVVTVLGASALIMATRLGHWSRIDLGFDADQVHFARFSLPDDDRVATWQRRALAESTARRLAETPGIESAAISQALPMVRGFSTQVTRDGDPATQDIQTVMVHAVTTGFGDTLGILQLAGRAIEARDTIDNQPVAVVSAAFARTYPSGKPIGSRLRLSGESFWRDIVGVVEDIRPKGGSAPVAAHVQIPLAQYRAPDLFLTVRSSAALPWLQERAIEAFAATDPEIPIEGFIPYDAAIRHAVASQRWLFWYSGGHALAALVIALASVYATLALMVASNSQSLAIRLALGSPRFAVGRRVILEGVACGGLGLAAGLILVTVSAHALPTLGPIDAYPKMRVVLASIMVLLLLCAAAGLLPAWRAARINPAGMLRDL